MPRSRPRPRHNYARAAALLGFAICGCHSMALAQQAEAIGDLKATLHMSFKVRGGPVAAVAFSRDGRWLASGGANGDLIVWDRANEHREHMTSLADSRAEEPVRHVGRIVRIGGGRFLGQRSSHVHAVALSPKGRFVAALIGGKLHVFDIATSKRAIEPVKAEVTGGLAFTSDGHLAYFAKRRVHILDPKLERTVAKIKTLTSRHILFDGPRMIVARPKGFIERYTWPEGKSIDYEGPLSKLSAFDRIGSVSIVGYTNGKLRFGDRWLDAEQPLVAIAASPKQDRFVTVEGDGKVRWFDKDARLEETIDCGAGRASLAGATFSPDGELLALATRTQGVCLYRRGELVMSLNGHRRSTDRLCFSPDGNYLGVQAGSAWVVDVRKKRLGKPIPSRREVAKTKRAAAWGAGKLLPGCFVAGQNGPELMWLSRSGLTLLMPGRADAIRTTKVEVVGAAPSRATLSPSGRYLIYLDGLGIARMIDVRQNRNMEIDESERGSPQGPLPQWHPRGGKMIVTTRSNRAPTTMSVLDTEGRTESTIDADLGVVSRIEPRFSPDGAILVTMISPGRYRSPDNDRNELRLIRTSDGMQLQALTEPVTWWRFLSDDRALSHDRDGFQLWKFTRDVASGKVTGLGTRTAFEVPGIAKIRGATISANKKRLAVDDGIMVRVFDLMTTKSQ